MAISTRRQLTARKIRVCARNSFRPRFWRNLIGKLGSAVIEWDTPAYVPGAKTVPLHTILADFKTDSICLPILPRILGDTPYSDLVPLCALAHYFQPRRVFEFGTHMGATTVQMLANCPADAQCWTLDLSPEHRQVAQDVPDWDRSVTDSHIGRFFQGAGYQKRVTQILMNSMDFDPAPYRNSMDFIYVDAAHDYAFVANDSRKAFEMLAPGGVIVWHDYIHCVDVRQYLDNLSQTRRLLHIEDTVLAVYIDDANGDDSAKKCVEGRSKSSAPIQTTSAHEV